MPPPGDRHAAPDAPSCARLPTPGAERGRHTAHLSDRMARESGRER